MLNKIFKIRVLNTFAVVLAIIAGIYLISYWHFFKNSAAFLETFLDYFLIIIFCLVLDLVLVLSFKNNKSIVVTELIVALLVLYYIIFS